MSTPETNPEPRAGQAANNDLTCDVVIVGCGVGGLYAALNLPRHLHAVLLSKASLDQCDSMLAQGGICVMHDPHDYRPYFRDTMRAGHWENRRSSVDVMVRSSRAVINDLVHLGVDFEREPDGELAYTREGAHSRPRICFHADITGKEITTALLDRVRELPNVQILENVEMTDIIEEPADEDATTGGAAPTADEDATTGGAAPAAGEQHRCAGLVCRRTRPTDPAEPESPVEALGPAFEIRAPYTIWATGGIGGTYERSTNYRCLTGDACRIAREHGIRLEHMDYVQIHPTGLYSKRPGRTFLISESCRGEGAILLDKSGNRFVDELLPRDVVANAIKAQMEKDGTDHEWLSFERVDPGVVRTHFAHIYDRCLEEGYDILCEPVPIVPTQHYFMGGVWVATENSETSLPGLYAVGETSCNGVHGRNRLASNSLLEGLVFAQRAARDIAAREGLEAPDVDASMTREVPEGLVSAELSGEGEPAPGTSATDPASTKSCEEAERGAEAIEAARGGFTERRA